MRMRTFVAAGLLALSAAAMGAGTASASDNPQGFELESGFFEHRARGEFMNVGGENGVTWAAKAEQHRGGGLEIESGH
ncbi:hypothetical protein [Streptomyces ziwulingensis]|uniref:Uncharacterized protein n=1 Tax=Streptomyces ziwulingensis TaxID=1045501 RepID=A0ABP9BPU9_9ACTN